MIPGEQLHFRCAFDLLANNKSDDQWGPIVRRIREWVAGHLPDDENLPPKLFYTGMDWESQQNRRLIVHTDRINGEGSPPAPQFWAVHFEHPCSQLRQRTWGVDIGLTRRQVGAWRCVISVSHWLKQRYIGPEALPDASAPSIVGNLIGSKFWTPFNGEEQLVPFPHLLRVTEGKAFAERLETTRRYCPIVLVTVEYRTGQPKLSPYNLAKLLCGSASVYYAVDSELDKELEQYLPKHLRCWNGAVRVYQPFPNFKDERDSGRHRYFNGDQIDSIGSDEVIHRLVNGIARRGPYRVGDVCTSIDDLARRKQRFHLAQMGRELLSKGNDATVSELRGYNKLLEEEIAKLGDDISTASELLSESATQQQQLQESEQVDQWNIRRLNSENASLRLESSNLARNLTAIQSLKVLPRNLLEVVQVIRELHAGRILFTDGACESARIAACSDVEGAWECLFAASTTLWELHFGSRRSENIAGDFRNATGFEIALSEGKQTHDDPKFMRLRRHEWNGEIIDIEPHIKIDGDKSKLLRVHYYAHPARRLIIVGHCGDHLDNYSTRKRR
jgi:hypothetical protein